MAKGLRPCTSWFVAQVSGPIGRRQRVWPVLDLERQPCRREVRIGLFEAGGAAERRTGDVDLHMPEPDARRPVAGGPDPADGLPSSRMLIVLTDHPHCHWRNQT